MRERCARSCISYAVQVRLTSTSTLETIFQTFEGNVAPAWTEVESERVNRGRKRATNFRYPRLTRSKGGRKDVGV